MKRLLCVISGMNAGGAETFLMKVYRAIDRNKYQMDFCINVKEKCFYEDEIINMGGRVYRIPSKSENLSKFKKQLSTIVSEQKYYYVLRVTSSAMGFMDLKIAKDAGAKKCVARSSNSSDGGNLKAIIAHYVGRALYGKYVDVKIAPSDLAAKYTFGFKAYHRGEVNLLHNAIDIERFEYSEDGRNKVRDELNIAKNAKVIGHIGRFSEQKNHTFLIDIFRQIKKDDKKAVLLLVGNGSLESQIRRKIQEEDLEENVIFAGIRTDIQDVLSAMDVFVFPSLFEGMPNTVIEAQANGLHCIIANTITKEANITGLVEYMSLSSSPKEWAKRISNINTKHEIQTSKFLEQQYDIKTMVQDFIKIVYRE